MGNIIKRRIVGNLGKKLLIIAGTIFIGLAILGILLPILPTTPFLLLAAACYARSSERFSNWLLGNRLFGKVIKDYREGKGMPLKLKALFIVFLWATIGCSAAFAVDMLPVRIVLIVVGVGVTAHIVLIRPSERWQRQSI